MKNPGRNRLNAVLGLTCFALLLLSGYLFWSYGHLHIRVAGAAEQTEIFEQMRARALQAGVSEAVQCLAYVTHYYPSGSKQERGSKLDTIVERERNRAEREIVVYLRSKADHDLGDDPELWIQTYAGG